MKNTHFWVLKMGRVLYFICNQTRQMKTRTNTNRKYSASIDWSRAWITMSAHFNSVFKSALVLFGALQIVSCCPDCAAIDKLVQEVPIPIVQVGETIYSAASDTFELVGDDRYKCRLLPTTQEAAYSEYIVFQPNADLMYPGSLVHGKGLSSGLLQPIDVKRAGGKLTLVNLNNNQSREANIDNVDLGKVSAAISTLLPGEPVGQVANIEFQRTNAYNLEQSMMHLGASAKWLKGGVRAKLNSQFDNSKNKVMVLFKQAYYTVVFNRDSAGTSYKPSSLLDRAVSLESFQGQMGNGQDDPPAFIKSVTYGRILYAVFSSDSSHASIEKELTAKLKTPKISGSVDISTLNTKLASYVSMTAFIIGGGAKDGVEFVAAGDMDGLGDYLRSGASWSSSSPGAPIAYKAVYLKNQENATMKEVVSYTKKDCELNPPVIDRITVHLNGITDTKKRGTSVSFHALKRNHKGEWQAIGSTPYFGNDVVWQGNAEVGTIVLNEYADRVDLPNIKVVMNIQGGDDLAANGLVFVVKYKDGKSGTYQLIPRGEFHNFELRSRDGTAESPLVP